MTGLHKVTKTPEVLWVEDVPATARGVLRRLEFRTHRGIAHFVGDVETARTELRRRRWKAVVFDLQLPLDQHSRDTVSDHAGPDLIRSLKSGELGPTNVGVSFVVHTAIGIEAGLMRETGCMGVFHKVDDPDPMVELIARHVNSTVPTQAVDRWKTPGMIRASDRDGVSLFIDAWDAHTPVRLGKNALPLAVLAEVAEGRFPVPVLVEASLKAEVPGDLDPKVLALAEIPSDEELGF